MTKLKTKVVDHGIDSPQYFPGCGVAFSNYDYVTTGAGDTFAEAIDFALESMAQSEECDGIDFAQLRRDIAEDGFGTVAADGTVAWQWSHSANAECAKANGGEYPEDSDLYYYVSVRYGLRSEEADTE